VLVPFPFSDLTSSKLRPAICLADAGRGDWILCQITSKAYGDPAAQRLTNANLPGQACASRVSRGLESYSPHMNR
jgi:mRNA interferase MazF